MHFRVTAPNLDAEARARAEAIVKVWNTQSPVAPPPSLERAFRHPTTPSLDTELARGRSDIGPAPTTPRSQPAPAAPSFTDIFEEPK